MSLQTIYDHVREFHQVFKHAAPSKPTKLTVKRAKQRANWHIEEAKELRDARTIEDQADACIDELYFVIGTLVEMGINPDPLFAIVHAANMSKQDWPEGKGARFREGDGKVLKPPTWVAPESALRAEIARQIIAAS